MKRIRSVPSIQTIEGLEAHVEQRCRGEEGQIVMRDPRDATHQTEGQQ